MTDFVTQAFERQFCNVTDKRLRQSKNRRPIGLSGRNSEVDSNLTDQEEASLILTGLSSSGPAVCSEAETLLTSAETGIA